MAVGLLAMAASGLACAQPAPPAGGEVVWVDELPGRLREISGLTLLDERRLGAVQDEKGTLFVLDLETGEVLDERDFGKDHDYEGVERVGRRVFVLRSDGDLYEIEDWQAADLDAERHETRLKGACDAEGLAYDVPGGRLLIACKEFAGEGLPHHRAIYAYDLQRGAVGEAPAFVIDTEALDRATEPNPLNRAIRSLLRGRADLSPFKPSAVAVHPETGQVYVLSSVRKLLVILNPDGAVHAAQPLPEDLLPQPEGLVILPGGDLLIASEGAGGRGRLVRLRLP